MCHWERGRTRSRSPRGPSLKTSESGLFVKSHDDDDDIRCKMVVFPAFALPTMRIRNLISWGARGRILGRIVSLLLLVVGDLDLACPILCRCEKDSRKGLNMCVTTGTGNAASNLNLCTPAGGCPGRLAYRKTPADYGKEDVT
jgi:hypothetical protein